MESVIVYKMRTYFRELEIERSTGLLYIQNVVQTFTATSKLSE
jgi:hypothetical protein